MQRLLQLATHEAMGSLSFYVEKSTMLHTLIILLLTCRVGSLHVMQSLRSSLCMLCNVCQACAVQSI